MNVTAIIIAALVVGAVGIILGIFPRYFRRKIQSRG